MEGDSVKYNIHSSVGRLHLLMCAWSLDVGEGGGFALLNIPSQDPGCRCLQSSAAAETLIITLASIQEAGAGPRPRLRRISSYSFHRGHRKRCHQEDDGGSAEVRGLPGPASA